jgi:hypothetical protein
LYCSGIRRYSFSDGTEVEVLALRLGNQVGVETRSAPALGDALYRVDPGIIHRHRGAVAGIGIAEQVRPVVDLDGGSFRS